MGKKLGVIFQNIISMSLKTILISLFSMSLMHAYGDIKLPVIFQDNMVLQRDKEIILWGWADPKEQIAVTIQDKKYQAITGNDGRWKIIISPQQAGGPYDITLHGKNNVTLKNILFGDVWICGGQSNMQFTIDQIRYLEKDTARANNAQLRLFTVPVDMDFIPRDDLKGGSWQIASVTSMQQFSATAYFFGRYLQESTHVPIGLVSVNLGATAVECWMSPAALSKFPQFNSFYKEFLEPAKSFQQVTSEFEKQKSSWSKKYYQLDDPGLKEEWYKPSTSTADWKTMQLPTWWEHSGLPDYDGSVWFRKEFNLPNDFKGDSFLLQLNQIDDYDMVWVNGEKIGEGQGHLSWRNYSIPAKLLKPEKNVVVVRVFDAGGLGGLYTGSIWWNQAFVGDWLYKPGIKINAQKFKRPHVVNVSPFSTPSILFQGNLAPLKDLALKGAIWYQGESNAARAQEYKQLFPAMITDWRNHFHQGDFPFLFVQLANFMAEPAQPRESDWAELREAQASALTLPNTGMATAIDIGDANDIHPKNKWDVGKRLGLAALKVAYQKDITSSGPVYRSMQTDGHSVIITFTNTGSGLISRDKYGFIRGFAIAGKDRKFHWAKAFIQGETVVVSSDAVPDPIAVRYAWSDNPGQLDLYNKEELPAVPFRTDNWSIKTFEKKFSLNPWEM
jgi:sialate O-acetylesterase